MLNAKYEAKFYPKLSDLCFLPFICQVLSVLSVVPRHEIRILWRNPAIMQAFRYKKNFL